MIFRTTRIVALAWLAGLAGSSIGAIVLRDSNSRETPRPVEAAPNAVEAQLTAIKAVPGSPHHGTIKTTVRTASLTPQDGNKKHAPTSEKNAPNRDLAAASRVINGERVTKPEEYPFVVDLSMSPERISSTRFCTGTLIQPDVVLTAAHCVLNDGDMPDGTFATVGCVNLHDGDHGCKSGAETFRAVAGFVHPEYQVLGSKADAALLLLDGESAKAPVELSTQTPPENTTTWIVGYGIKEMGTIEGVGLPAHVMPKALQQTALRIRQRHFCDIPDALETVDGMLCTEGLRHTSSACRGDSGGGLFRQAGDHKQQVGIVSYGDAECMSEDSGVFTDVASVYSWIKEGVNKLHALREDSTVLNLGGTASAKVVKLKSATRQYHGDGAQFQRAVISPSVKFVDVSHSTDGNVPKRIAVTLCSKRSLRNTRIFLADDKARNIVRTTSFSCKKGDLGVGLTFDTKNAKERLVVASSVPAEDFEIAVASISH